MKCYLACLKALRLLLLLPLLAPSAALLFLLLLPSLVFLILWNLLLKLSQEIQRLQQNFKS